MSDTEFKQMRKTLKGWFALIIAAGIIISGITNFIVAKAIFANEVVTTTFQNKDRLDKVDIRLDKVVKAVEQLAVNAEHNAKLHGEEIIKVPNIEK